MTKYTNQELQNKALIALQSKALSEVRWGELIQILSHISGMSYQVVDRKIKELANWKPVEEDND